MKKLFSVIAVLVVAIGVGAWLNFSFRAKWKYDTARADLRKNLLVVIQIDADMKVQLAKVQTNWAESHSEIGGPHSEAIETVGLRPTVANLIEVFTYPLPEYWFLSSARNKKAATMGAVQAVILPRTVDGLIHVSEDQRLAIIRYGPDIVGVFTDDAGGLREATYTNKNNIEQGAERSAINRTP